MTDYVYFITGIYDVTWRLYGNPVAVPAVGKVIETIVIALYADTSSHKTTVIQKQIATEDGDYVMVAR